MKHIFNDKKILITGGAGFIGSHLAKSLVKLGADVFVIDNLWRGSIDNLKYENGKFAIDIKKNFYEADLTDYSVCSELISGYDYVYHLADVVSGINFVFNNELFVFRQNILINTNTITACLSNNIKNYIYAGTACSFPKHLQMVEGIAQLKEDQTYPAEPESSYGWSKLMGEYESELVQKYSLMNIGLLRFHNVYGPGSVYDKERSQVLPALIRKVVNHPDEEFIVWGNGEQYRDFVYISDIVEALLLTAEKGMNKGLIQIGSEKATSIKYAAETIVKISGKDIKIKYDPSGPQGDRGRIAECSIARNILGWSPKVSFEEGVSILYTWIKNRIE